SELRDAAHKIRGIANNLGATAIGDCAESIEQTVNAGGAVKAEQIEGLGDALAITAQSHVALLADRAGAVPATSASDINAQSVFADLKAAIGAFDPAAIALLDQLLATVEPDGKLSHYLIDAHQHLDNFRFVEAELLLEKFEEGMASAK